MKNLTPNSLRIIPAALGLVFSLLANYAGATVIYWDNNGTSTPGSGTWNTTSSQWAASSALTASTVVWATADAACFCAGATAPSGTLTITVNSAISCAGIFNGSLTPPGCNLVLSGSGSLNFINNGSNSGLCALDTSGSDGDPTVINIPITGVGAATVEGGAALYLNATNTYTGGTLLGYTANAFTSILNFTNAAAFGTGGILVSNTGLANCALQLEGTSPLTITNAFTWYQTNYSGVNIVGNAAGLTFSGPWTVPGTARIGSSESGYLVVISGVMSGAGGINCNCAAIPGILEFTAANTYTGATTITNGFLQLGDGVSKNGSVAGTITVTSPGALVFANPNAQTESKVISGTGSVTNQGPGVLTLSAVNTYSGGTTITNCTVKLGVANALPTTGDLDLEAGATLDMGSYSGSVNGLNGAGTVTNSTGTGTYTLTVGNGGDSGAFSGIITANINGTIALTKSGTGTETLSGANSYAGVTTVNAGTLQLGANNALPAASFVVVATNATLDLNNFNDTIAALSVSGLQNVTPGAVNNFSGTLTVSGNASPSNSVTFNAYSCISAPLYGGGSLIKGGTHSMAIRGALNNNFSGTITLNAGTLSVGAAPNLLPTSLALNVPAGALFQLDANSQSLAGLSGSGSVNLGGGILTLNGSSPYTFSGVIQNSELAGSSTALGNGLRGYYYTNIDMTVLAAVRDDSTVYIADVQTNLPPALLPYKTNEISVRWLGQVLTTAGGTYTFTTTSDDGQRLWVNGYLVIDNWTTHGPTAASGSISLSGNTRYDIVMEYFNGTDGGSTLLAWTPPGDPYSVTIPSANLFLPGPGSLQVGTGGQQLTGANTYSGGTTVINYGGYLEATANGALGSGNVAVAANCTLKLDANAAIASTADLILDPATTKVNLNFTGTNTIHGISFNDGGAYAATGVYGANVGANNPNSVFSGTGYLKVTANPSTTVLTSSPSSPATVVYGSTVTLTAAVSGSPGTPTGTVAFYDGANLLGASTLNGSGVATFSVNNLLVDFSPHYPTAVYNGDSTHATSTSASDSVSVTTTQALLTLSVVVSNKVYDATNTASISFASTNFTGIRVGDENYVHLSTNGAAAAFSDKIAANGKTVTLSGLSIIGSLADNYTLNGVTASTALANITPKALSVTGLTATNKVYNATTAGGGTATAAALQAAEAPGAGTTSDGKPYTGDSVTLTGTLNGSLTGTFASPNVGTNITVTMSGYGLTGGDSGNYTVSATATASITKGSSQDNFTSALNPSSQGASVTFTATLSAEYPSAGTPTGNVIFATNGVVLSTNALVGGVASASTAALPVGTTPVLAWYAGDTNFVGCTNSLSQVVNSATTCSATNKVLSITPNGVNSFTLTLLGTYNAQYDLLWQTNVAEPMTNWLTYPGSTNTVTNANGQWSITVTNRAPAFYRVKAMDSCN